MRSLERRGSYPFASTSRMASSRENPMIRWRERAEAANARTPWAELRALVPEHLRFRRDFERERRAGQRILRQREWFRLLLEALGYVNERRSRSSIRSLRWCQAHRQDA